MMEDDIELTVQAAAQEAAEAAPAEVKTAPETPSRTLVLSRAIEDWFNANIAASAAGRDPVVFETIHNALGDLAQDVAEAAPDADVRDILADWVRANFHNTAVSRDIDAFNRLTARLPQLAADLARLS